MPDDLVVFLRARLDDESRDATNGYMHAPEIPGYDGPWPETTAGLPPAVAVKRIAEVEAKRQMIATDDTLFCTSECWRPENTPKDPDSNWTVTIPHHYDCTAYRIAQVLALPYADHPEYRPEWAPEA